MSIEQAAAARVSVLQRCTFGLFLGTSSHPTLRAGGRLNKVGVDREEFEPLSSAATDLLQEMFLMAETWNSNQRILTEHPLCYFLAASAATDVIMFDLLSSVAG